jgi:hypothetical protein
MRPSTGLSSGAGEAGSWSGCLLPGCQQLLVSRWRHLLAGRVPPFGVVVLDPGRYLGLGGGLGSEVLGPAQFELQGGVPGFDDRVIPRRQLRLITSLRSESFG